MITPQKRAQNEVRKIRYEMRLNQYDFAKLMNVSRDTIFAWEKGYRNPVRTGELLSTWWRGPIKAARIAGRIIQAAFS